MGNDVADVACGTLCVANVSLTRHLSADVATDMVVFNLWLAHGARNRRVVFQLWRVGVRAIPSGNGTFQSKVFRPPKHGGDLLLAEK